MIGIRLDGTNILSHKCSFLSSRKGEKMKIYIDLPWGGKLSIEREPMEKNKFYTMWWCITLYVAALAFFSVLK